MNREGDHDEVMQRRLDWALREVAGGEQAPDVTAAVLARAARGEVVDEGTVAPAKARPWLAAALLLLGIGVVVGVYFARQAPPLSNGPRPALPSAAQDQDAPHYVRVTNRIEIAALPADTPYVEAASLNDEDFAELSRFTNLQGLTLVALYFGDDPTRPRQRFLSDAVIPFLNRFDQLRELHLWSQTQLTGEGFEVLATLPKLHKLELTSLDLSDDSLAFLPRMPALTELQLVGNRNLGPATIATVARCPGLRSLTVNGQPDHHWRSEDLAPLAQLTHLEELSLTSTGIDDAGLSLLSKFPHLRRLNLFGSLLDGSGFASLPESRSLTTLQLVACSNLQPNVGGALRKAFPMLRDLEFRASPLIDDTTVAEVLGLRFLRKLDLNGCSGVSEYSLPLLTAATQLHEVCLSGASWLTVQKASQLFASGKRVIATKQGDAKFHAGLAALLQMYEGRLSLPRYETVQSLAELQALPADVTHIAVRGLGDDAAPALSRRTNLLGLQFFQNGGRLRLSDAAFAAFAKLPNLESLELRNVDGVHDSGLRQLQTLPKLRSLRLCVMNSEDDSLTMLAALASLPEFPALTELSLDGTTTFLEDGIKAIAACTGLQSLSLRGCTQLQPDWIALLGGLTGLESLDLSDAGGLNDRALMGLQSLTRLRSLMLANGKFTSKGMQAIEGMTQLQSLIVNDNQELVSSALLHVPTSVTELVLEHCNGIDATAGALLRDRFPGLTALALAQNDWVDDTALAAILGLPKLEILSIRDCKNTTAKSFAAILGAKSLRRLDASRCAWLTDERSKILQEKHPELQLVRKVW